MIYDVTIFFNQSKTPEQKLLQQIQKTRYITLPFGLEQFNFFSVRYLLNLIQKNFSSCFRIETWRGHVRLQECRANHMEQVFNLRSGDKFDYLANTFIRAGGGFN